MKRIALAALVFALLCAVGLSEEIAVRSGNGIPVYKGPTGHTRFLGWAKPGAQYEVLDTRYGAKNQPWIKIRLEDGQEGYMRRYATTPVVRDADAQAVDRVMVHPGENAHVRSHADSKSPRMGSAQAGSVYPVLGSTIEGWLPIALENGTTGWVDSHLVFRYDPDCPKNVTIRYKAPVAVREEPHRKSPRLAGVMPDTTYPCIQKTDNGWYEIQLPTGRYGFVRATLAEPAAE